MSGAKGAGTSVGTDSGASISVEEYVGLICKKGATRAVVVRQNNEEGIILIRAGRIYYAAHSRLKGEAAFYKLLSWKSPQLFEVTVDAFPAGNIKKDQAFLLPETTPLIEESDVATMSPPIPLPKPLAYLLNQKKETVTSQVDEEKESKTNRHSSGRSAAVPGEGSGTRKLPYRSPQKGRRGLYALLATACIALASIAGLYSWNILSLNGKDGHNASTLYANLPVPRTVQPVAATSGVQPPTSKNSALANKESGEGQAVSAVPPLDISPNSQTKSKTLSIAAGKASLTGNSLPSVVPLPEHVILRLHGSNTIGANLAPALVRDFFKNQLKAERVEKVVGKKDNEVYLKARFADRIEVVEIYAHGSSTGFADMNQDACDIAMASRRIKGKEAENLARYGDMNAITNEHVIALDGIAVIINKSNPITKLSMEQVGEIFAGKIKSWAQVGGKDEPITVYARDNSSGTFDTFKHLVLGKTLQLSDRAERFESNPELSDRVARDPGGIGFTSLPNIRNAKAVSVADHGAAPIYPSFFTVATEDYPISRRLYLYTAANPKNSEVRDFIEYVQSFTGQKVVKNEGLVDMNIKPFYVDKSTQGAGKDNKVIDEYLKATDAAKRLSLNFRFKKGATDLDNRGTRDLDRIVAFLQNRLDNQIMLAGFSDDAGDYDFNLKLAQVRANVVADQLRSRGLPIAEVISGGEEMPVATNATNQGREKNRRVEVWLK